jgi:hypothetical protein
MGLAGCQRRPRRPVRSRWGASDKEKKISAGPETPTFERDIKPLFRDQDVRSMAFAFDLKNHDEVAANGTAILSRLEAGNMPCDAPWPDERVALFRRWVTAGSPP